MELMPATRASRLVVRPGLVGALLLAAALPCSCSSRKKASAARPFPPLVELSLGEKLVFYPKELRGGDAYHFVSGKDGELWVLRHEGLKPLMAARLEKGAEPSFESINPEGWTSVARVTVVNNGSGDPVVIMMGTVGGPSNTYVAVREWTGQRWTEPVQLDFFTSGPRADAMVSLLDSKGRIHVAYDRNLVPRETYGIMHGEFPDKCFHAWFDGKSWTRPQPTTGKGKFYADPRFLSELADGNICLGISVDPFSGYKPKPEYVGCQLWDGKKWSGINKKVPKEAYSGAEDQPVFDYWGNSISRMRKGGREYCVLKKRGSGRAETVELLSAPVMMRDRAGRIIVCSANSARGEVRLWNGDRWAGKISYPLDRAGKIGRILCNPDGNLLLIHETRSRVVIQRIRPAPTTQDVGSNTATTAAGRAERILSLVDACRDWDARSAYEAVPPEQAEAVRAILEDSLLEAEGPERWSILGFQCRVATRETFVRVCSEAKAKGLATCLMWCPGSATDWHGALPVLERRWGGEGWTVEVKRCLWDRLGVTDLSTWSQADREKLLSLLIRSLKEPDALSNWHASHVAWRAFAIKKVLGKDVAEAVATQPADKVRMSPSELAEWLSEHRRELLRLPVPARAKHPQLPEVGEHGAT